MYKSRVKAWGPRKHNRRREVETILRIKSERERPGKLSTFVLGSKESTETILNGAGRGTMSKSPTLTQTSRLRGRFRILLAFTPPSSPSPQPSSPTVKPSSSDTSSPNYVPRAIALPVTLGHREDCMRGVAVGFELMIKTGHWKLSTQLEMPWTPVLVHAICEPVISDSYHQDKYFRYLTNGVAYNQKGDVITACKE